MSENGPTAQEQLTIQILTQIRDNLDLIRRKQDTFGENLNALSERTVRLEERNERLARLEAELERERTRIDLLAEDKSKRDGAISAWSWLGRHWPTASIGAALAALIAWANGKLG